MNEFSSRIDFTNILLSSMFLVLSATITVIFFLFYRKKGNRLYNLLPSILTLHLSTLILILINIFSKNLFLGGTLLFSIIKYLLMIILVLVIFIVLERLHYSFEYMSFTLKMYFMLILFLFGVVISDNFLLNSLMVITVSLVFIIFNFSNESYYNSKEKSGRMNIISSTLLLILPLLTSFSLLIVDINKFNFEDYSVNSNLKLFISIIELILLIWNIIVIMMNIYGKNIYRKVFKK